MNKHIILLKITEYLDFFSRVTTSIEYYIRYNEELIRPICFVTRTRPILHSDEMRYCTNTTYSSESVTYIMTTRGLCTCHPWDKSLALYDKHPRVLAPLFIPFYSKIGDFTCYFRTDRRSTAKKKVYIMSFFFFVAHGPI